MIMNGNQNKIQKNLILIFKLLVILIDHLLKIKMIMNKKLNIRLNSKKMFFNYIQRKYLIKIKLSKNKILEYFNFKT